MEFKGSVHGEYARKFPGFCYRKPVMRPVEHEHRPLSSLAEYPRFVSKVADRIHDSYVELADYAVTIGATGDDGMSKVELWLLPNEYTQERSKRRVCEFMAANAFTLRHQYCDEALRRTFGLPAARR